VNTKDCSATNIMHLCIVCPHCGHSELEQWPIGKKEIGMPTFCSLCNQSLYSVDSSLATLEAG